MNHATIRADQVQPGDQIYNRHAYHASAAWITVRAVETDNGRTSIRTDVYTEVLSSAVGIAVYRKDQRP